MDLQSPSNHTANNTKDLISMNDEFIIYLIELVSN